MTTPFITFNFPNLHPQQPTPAEKVAYTLSNHFIQLFHRDSIENPTNPNPNPFRYQT